VVPQQAEPKLKLILILCYFTFTDSVISSIEISIVELLDLVHRVKLVEFFIVVNQLLEDHI